MSATSQSTEDRLALLKRPDSPAVIAGLTLLLAGITTAAYFRAVYFPFVNYDDPQYVVFNPNVTLGLSWQNTRWAFTTFYAANWHPLTWLSLQADASIWGADPFGYHLTNIVLHVVNTVLVFFTIRSLTGAVYRSALVAALFGVHPLHVESVVWVTERKDVLSGFFWLTATLAYSRFVQTRRWTNYLLVCTFLALGLLSKPLLVTLPCALLLLDIWPLRRNESWTQLAVEKLPLFALVAIACFSTFVAQQAGRAVASVGSLGIGHRIANAICSYGVYLGQTLWPTPLVPFYPLLIVDLTPERVVLSTVILIALTAGALLTRKSHPYVLVGWLWYLGTLVPMIGIVQVGSQAHADRYTYIPHLGVFIIFVWGMADLVQNRSALRVLASAGSVAIVLGLTAVCQAQVTHWKDMVSLWTHTVSSGYPSALAHSSLGSSLATAGRNEEALRHYERAITLDPTIGRTHAQYGETLTELERVDEGLRELSRARELDPLSPYIFERSGKVLNKLKRYKDAQPVLEKAIQLDPERPDYWNEWGVSLQHQNQFREAENAYRKAIKLIPQFAEAHYNLAVTLTRQSQHELAIPEFLEAIRLNSADASAHSNLGASYAQLGQWAEAVAQYRKAVELDSSLVSARLNLGLALLRKHELEGALEQAEAAAEINSKNVAIQLLRGRCLALSNRHSEAVGAFEAAVQAEPGNLRARANLAVAQFAAGDPAGPANLENLIRLDPNWPERFAITSVKMARPAGTEQPNGPLALELAELALSAAPTNTQIVQSLLAALIADARTSEIAARIQNAADRAAQTDPAAADEIRRLGQTAQQR